VRATDQRRDAFARELAIAAADWQRIAAALAPMLTPADELGKHIQRALQHARLTATARRWLAGRRPRRGPLFA